jgi:hypothetical protein
VHKICKFCFYCFSSTEVLNEHLKTCQKILIPNNIKSEYINNEKSNKLLNLEVEKSKRIYKTNKMKNNKFYICEQCDYVSKSIKNLCSHEKVHEPKKNSCKLCEKIFSRKYSLKTHILGVHMQIYKLSVNKKSIKCPPLKYKTTISENGLELFFCNYCKSTFSSLLMLRSHQNNNHNLYKCLSCGRMFSKKNSLNTHIAIKHLNFDTDNTEFVIENILQCTSSDNNELNNEDDSDEEIDMVENSVLNNIEMNNFDNMSTLYYRCEVCCLNFINENTLDSHIQTIHSDNEI